MQDLRDFGLCLPDINEGILDDMEVALDAGTTAAEKMDIEKWFVNKQCKVFKTKQGYVLHGDFKITEASSPYYGPKIKNVKGSLAIQGTDLETLEGMFGVDCDINGTFTLEDNDKLTSLKGCPLSCGTLVISGNKKLTDIDVAPMVHVNAYISGNGKKFKKDYIASKVQVYKHIFCAVDAEEKLINEEYLTEAFKAPQLKQVAVAIKKAQSKYVNYYGVADKPFRLNQFKEILWDKISASQITEYDVEDKKCMTMVRAYLSGKTRGIMVIMDNNGEVTHLIRGKNVLSLKRGDINSMTSTYSDNTTSILGTIEYATRDGGNIMFINLEGMDYHAVDNIQRDRRNTRAGALALQRGNERTGEDKYGQRIDTVNIRYYQSIADDNRERYKKMLVKLKAERVSMSNTFAAIKARIDKVFDRYTNILADVVKSPAKYDNYSWEVNSLTREFADSLPKDKRSIKSSGLFYIFREYMSYMIGIGRGSHYGRADIADVVKAYEDKIEYYLNRIEQKLTKLETVK